VSLKPIDRVSRRPAHAPRHAAPPIRKEPALYAGSLALVALLVPFHALWAAQVLLILLLLTVPGLILLRALRVPGRVVSSFPAYIPCGSIIMLFGSGFLVDVLGPLTGVAAPLRTAPLLIGLEFACLVMLAASLSAPPDVAIPWRSLSRPARLAWPLILPLVAGAGALRLNNGFGNTIAVIAICALIALLVTAAAVAVRLGRTALTVVLYAAGLSMTWSDSLRGSPLYGFDIATEYQRLQQAVATGVWHPAHPNDAYGAMLSLTVMPASLHALSGVSALLVFKIVYPMVYAFFPVAIFGLANKVLSCRWSFIAAAFTIGQYAFSELAGFARQQIALVLFAALVTAMLETAIRRRWQWALVALLGVATALSHYSTTYVAITVIGLMLPLQYVTSWFRKVPRVTGAVAVAFIATLGSAVIWYGPVTHSDSHVLAVVQTVQAQGLDLLPNRLPGGNLITDYLQGNTRTAIPAQKYAQDIKASYAVNHPFIKPLRAAALPRYTLRDSPIPEPRIKWHLVYNLLDLSFLLIEQLANVLTALGAILLIIRRKTTVIARQIGLLTLAVTMLLTVLRFSGTLAIAYGQERAQIQGFALLAVALCWVLQGVADIRKSWRSPTYLLAVGGLIIAFLNTTYLMSAIFGGQTSVNLANSGPAYEYFYTTAPEMAAAYWLGSNVQPGQLVYADEYAQVPLAAATEISQGLFADLTPQTINQDAWVYASRTNVIDKRAFALYNEHLATYVFPAAYLSNNYDLVYTDGSSEVFHR